MQLMKIVRLGGTLGLALAAMGAGAASYGLNTLGSLHYEQVRFYNPPVVGDPLYVGSLAGTDYCAGVDNCGSSMSFNTYYGGTLKATASDDANGVINKTNAVVYQDLSPLLGGLGVGSTTVDTKGKTVLTGSNPDEINWGDALTLTFAKTVTVVGFHFFDGDHTLTNPGETAMISIDGGAWNTISLASYVTADKSKWLTGKSFSFKVSGNKNCYDDFYLGAIKITSAIPEPAHYALMMAGLLCVGGVSARRRAQGVR